VKILFVLHELTRTGSPLVMLNFLRWLKKYTPHKIMVVALKTGELQSDFESVVDNLILQPPSERNNFKTRFKNKLLLKDSPRLVFNKQLLKLRPDLIYANSVPTFSLAIKIKQNTNVRLIAHLHEARTMLELIDKSWINYYNLIDQFIVPSQLVLSDLQDLIKTKDINVNVVRETPVSEIKPKLSTNSNFIVGGSGTVHWRKGPELFIQVAIQFFKRNPVAPVKFQWIGHIDKVFKIIYTHDIEKAGLEGKIEFLGSIKNPIDFYEDFSVFLMTSREDPYPLVCVENGLLGNPIISFEGATGINETIADGGGIIVPYLDTVAMAEAVETCFENRDLLIEMGEKAQNLFKTSDFDIVFPALNDIINLDVN
jgi:glycosyltransferase involved in cell wall biosynthesis